MENNTDPKYIKNVYNALKTKVDGFNKTEQEFNESLKDPIYVQNVHKALKTKVDGFNKNIEDFTSLVTPIKKKDSTKDLSTSTSNGQILVLEQKNGSLATTNNSFLEQIKQPDPSKNEYKDFDGTIKTNQNISKKPKNQNLEVANKAYDYALSKVDKTLSEERFASEIDNNEITDQVKRGFKSVYNHYFGKPLTNINKAFGGDKDFSIGEYKPLEKELIQAEKELKEEFGTTAIPKEELQQKAKEIFIKNDIQEQLHSYIDEALPTGYDREGVWKELKLKELRSNDILREKVASAEVFKSQIQEFEQFSKGIDKNNVTQEQIDKFTELKEKAITAADGLKYLSENFDTYLKQTRSDQEKLELFKYNYDDFEKSMNLLYGSALNIEGGAIKLISDTSKYSAEKIGLDTSVQDFVSENIGSEMMKDAEKASTPFYRYKASKINSWSDLGSFSNQLISEQIPVLASIYLGGNVGTGLVSASSGGQKLKELDAEGNKYSNGEKLAAAWLYAGAEFIPEKLGTARILKDVENTITAANSTSRKLFKDSLIKSTLDGAKKLAYYSALEGTTEYITAESQIAIDRDLLGIVKTDFENNEQRAESFLSGALMGGGMYSVGGTLNLLSAQAKLYSDSKDIKEVQSTLSEINAIQNEIETNELLTEKEKTELYKEMNKLSNQAFSTISKNANKGVDLSLEDKSNLLDINQKQTELKEKYNELKDSNYSKDIKNKKVKELESEFNSLEENRNSILQGNKPIQNKNDEVQNTTTKTKQEAQPQTEVKETEQEKLNETAPKDTTITDGENGVGVGENSSSQQTNTEVQNKNIPSTSDTRANEKPIEVKLSDNSKTYSIKKENGIISVTDSEGKKPSKSTKRKILDEYSNTIDFTQGEAVSDTFNTSAETYIDDVAERSKNASEIAEALTYTQNNDFNEGIDTISLEIANALGSKSVEKSSFTQFGDRNNISQSIAMQYFSKKGKGKGLDQIAMEVEEAVFGDYDAQNPRVTEQDIIDFMLENPRGSQSFINSNKKEKLDKLKTAFTDVTGLPATDNFIQKALKQANDKSFRLKNEEVLYAYTDEQLLSLNNDYNQFIEFENGTEKTNTSNKGSVNNENKEKRREESEVQEARGRQYNTEKTVDKKAIDKTIDWLNELDKRLKDFGDETLGINIPVVVARGAVKAMKAAAQTAKTVQEIIDAGLEFVKQSEWYQNLSKKEQSDINSNFKDYINKPFEGSPQKKSRLKIEEEVQERLDNNESEQDILDSITERREKMIAKDYISRKTNLSVPEVRKKISDSFNKADAELKDNKTTTEKLDKAFRNFISKFFDRQFVPKFILNKAGGRLVRNYLIASKGATGYAKQMYDEAYDRIYKGLTSSEVKTLDKIIQLRRFLAIDTNRAERDLPNVVHPDFINKNDVEIELKELEKEFGKEKYQDLIKRADNYFKEFKGLLTEMEKSGLISKESLEQFFEIDYQPRMFLEFLKENETDFVPDNSSNASLSKDQILKLEEGLNTSLIYDSQYLLSRSMNIRAKSIAMNNANKKLVEFMEKQTEVVDKLRTKKEKNTIKYFDELSKRVKENPIIGFTDTGNPKYKYKLPDGFKNAYYYVDGVKHSIMMEEAFHEQYFDASKGFLNGNAKEVAAIASGTAMVKALATGNNPTFFITNTPRDFLFISTFSEEYGMSVPVNMAKLTKDATLGIRDIIKENDSFKNFIKYGGMMDFLKDQGKLKRTKIQKMFDKIDNKKREKISSIFNFVTFSKLQVYSEIGFRMAVFNRSIKNQLKELGLKNIDQVTDKNQVDDIYTNAVASARGLMDFNQGGTITKDADAFIPYLNAATQGTRVMFDNFRERPFETTFRVAQTSAILSSAAIGTSIAMFAAFGDEDEDKTPTEQYLYAKKGVSKYDQTNYFIIFTGRKTADGQHEYIRIAKPQQLTPFFSATDGMLTSFIKNKIGDESPTDAVDNVMFALEKNISPVEFGVTGNFARNPLLKSALTYTTGYDFYREENLSYLRGKVPVPAEGFESKTVEDFYKKIGEETGMSPVRFKAAIESYITTPSTSPYVGFLYGGLDAMASDKDGKQIIKKLADDIQKSTLRRLKKETTDFNRRLSNNKALQKKMEKVEIENLKTKTLFKRYAEAYVNKEMSLSDISKEIGEIAKENTFEAKRLKKMIKDKIKNQNVSSYVFEIKYAKSAESKALMLIDLFGDDLKDFSKLGPEEKKLIFEMKKLGAINKETLLEYNRLIKE